MIRRRRSAVQPQFSFSKKGLKIVALVLAAGVGVVAGLLVSLGSNGVVFPTITTVHCTLEDGKACSADVHAALIGQPIIFSNIGKLSRNDLLTNGLTLQHHTRIWPNTVALVVRQAPIEFQIKTPSGLFGVMHDRKVVSMQEPLPSKPTVIMADTLRPAEYAPPWLYQSVVASWNEAYPTAMELISPVELRINLHNGPMEFILNPQEIEENLGRMRAIVASEEAVQLARIPGELDVRLRLPVLRKAQ